ncbi:MAG: acyl-CoA dehydrogenase family protein [Gemmatimonadales bacterium]|jgi:alkylation response protein AidB-like acyl-CoA dehydrogenase
MDFGFDDAQSLLATSVRDVIESRYPIAYVREMLGDPRGFSKDFWSDASELGWLGLLVAERFGGAGLGPLELVAVQQELGRGVLPGPFLSSAILATAALDRAGSEAQKQRWLARLVAGDAIATVALQEPRGGWDAAGVTLPARPGTGDALRLTGEKRFVPDAHVADLLIVPARTEDPGEQGTDGVTLLLVEASAPGVSVRTMETIDPTRRLCEVHLDAVAVGPEAVLGEPGAGWPLLEAVMDLGRVALCAEMVGGAERALEMSTGYARTREQFGRPIGSFQAIQHKCADMLVQLEGARAMTFAAATSLAHGDSDASRDASIAKAWCGEAYRAITTEGVQIHGGLGFTWDLDMHLHYKRAKASEALLGDARFHRARVAEQVLGSV